MMTNLPQIGNHDDLLNILYNMYQDKTDCRVHLYPYMYLKKNVDILINVFICPINIQKTWLKTDYFYKTFFVPSGEDSGSEITLQNLLDAIHNIKIMSYVMNILFTLVTNH